MEQKASEVSEKPDTQTRSNQCLWFSLIPDLISLQCPSNTSPQKHMKNRSKSTEKMQQSKKVNDRSNTFIFLGHWLHLIWLSAIVSQAIAAQKSLPGRPELSRVKVNNPLLLTAVGCGFVLFMHWSICTVIPGCCRSVPMAQTQLPPPLKKWSDEPTDKTLRQKRIQHDS